MHLTQSGISLLRYDEDWILQEADRLVDEEGVSASMTSGVYLPNGSLILQARVNPNALNKGERSFPSASGTLTDDGGNIVRYVFDRDGELANTQTLYEGTDAHRVHTALVGDLLITT